MTDLSETRTIAAKALDESLADVSAAKACGEYWVQQLEQKAYEYDVLKDKCATLEKDLTEVCRLRLEAADSFSKQIIELENKVRELEAAARWIPVGERLPEDDGTLPAEYCSFSFDGNEKVIDACSFWCRYIFDDQVFYGEVAYDFEYGEWVLKYEGERMDIRVTHWMPLPQPPESEGE